MGLLTGLSAGFASTAWGLSLVIFLLAPLYWLLQGRFDRGSALQSSRVITYPGDFDTDVKDELSRCVFLQSTNERMRSYGNSFQSLANNGVRTVHTIEPDNIQTWSAQRLKAFSRFELNKEMAEAIWGEGVLNADGSVWQYHRSLIRPTFKKESVAQFHLFRSHVDRLLERLPIDCVADAFPLFKDYIFDSGTEFLFGQSAYSQDAAKADALALSFSEAFERITVAIGKRRHVGMQAVREQPGWTEDVHTLYNFLDCKVAQALQRRATEQIDSQHDEAAGKTVLLYEMAEQTQDTELLRRQLLHVFTPAHESTGSLLSNIVYALAHHPCTYERLREEVMQSAIEEPTWNTLKGLTYLNFVIKETLRLWPLFVSNTRLCIEDTLLPRGGGEEHDQPIFVRKGDLVSANIYALHRSETLWGADAAEFKPERWQGRKQGWEYLPFNGGGHVCPAQNLALTEAAHVIFRLVRAFKAIEAADQRPWVEKMGLSVRNLNGVLVRFQREALQIHRVVVSG